MDYEYNNAEDYAEEYEDFPKYKPQTRNIRRQNKRKALEKRKKIVVSNHKKCYNPAVGYYKWKCIKESGKYYFKCNNHLSYPKNSKAQQYIKKRTAKHMRRIPLEELYGKNNIHHKHIDYWWELY